MSTPRRRGRRRAKGLPNWRIVRYADDFVILVHGTRDDVQTLREDITHALAPLGLRLSQRTGALGTAHGIPRVKSAFGSTRIGPSTSPTLSGQRRFYMRNHQGQPVTAERPRLVWPEQAKV